MAGAFVEDIELSVLFERDKGLCGLCRRKVNPKLKYPHRGSASIDHIIPFSKGGEHSYANTQLAHFGCNGSKGAGAVGEQLRLLG